LRDIELSLQAYHRNGFAVLEGVFSAEEMRLVRAHVQRCLHEMIAAAEPGEVYYEDERTRSVRCAFRMHERSAYLRQLMGEPRLLDIVETLFAGAQAIQDGVQLIDKAPLASYEFPYHQDNAYQFWEPPEAVAVTLALDESTHENGAIVCLQGSHVLGVLPHQPSGVLGASLSLVEAPEIERYPEVPLCLRPGDLALHHANVIHRTGANRTLQHRRNLGFAYHSARATRDDQAHARYQRHVRQINRRLG
jgi:ectoine hydroxylase-related dioxygenase (phytanoyl-CoA dioxygenase family)